MVLWVAVSLCRYQVWWSIIRECCSCMWIYLCLNWSLAVYIVTSQLILSWSFFLRSIVILPLNRCFICLGSGPMSRKNSFFTFSFAHLFLISRSFVSRGCTTRFLEVHVLCFSSHIFLISIEAHIIPVFLLFSQWNCVVCYLAQLYVRKPCIKESHPSVPVW